MTETATPELLEVTQCSALLGLSEHWVYEMFRQGKLPGSTGRSCSTGLRTVASWPRAGNRARRSRGNG